MQPTAATETPNSSCSDLAAGTALGRMPWPDSREFWKSRRVIVTGGSGFLGSFLVERLRERGPADLFVVQSRDYDLRDLEAIRKLIRDRRPHIIIHLAARVGGIGANRAHPADFFYDNLMMGA